MTSSSRRRLMRGLGNAYDVMLLAYPPAFRRRFGREMAADLRRRLEDVAAGSSHRAVVAFVLEILWDSLRTVVREWLDETMPGRTVDAGDRGGISLFNENFTAAADTERSALAWSLVLACLGAFLLVEGWVRWFRLIGIWR